MEPSSTPGGDTGGTPPPSGPPAASPAAPTPSSPSPNFSRADFERASSAARSGPPEAPGSTTVAPNAASPDGTPPPVQHDPVPYDRFSEVNGKYDKVKWAEQYSDPEEVNQSVRLAQWLDQDPEAAVEFITSQLRRAGRLQAAPQAPPQAPAPQPGTGEDGRPLADVPVEGTNIKLYSAEQAMKLSEWTLQQAMAQLDKRVKPFEQAKQQQAVLQAAHSEASTQIQEASQWEGFTEHMDDIERVMAADRRLSLHTAYQRVVGPKLEARHRQKFAQELRTRSNGTTTNPGTQAAPSTAELRKLPMKELLRREFQRRGMGR